jgi:Tol biopolymer transport system component
MGEVYRSRDTRLDRIVAIKVLPERVAGDPDAKRRFEREARAVAVLNHPHICALYDIGEQDGVDYLVMEYLEGQTLADRLVQGAIGVGQSLQYAVQIADALDKAHRQGIVHRDLKPSNIVVTRSGAKLLDFGLAKSNIATAANAVTGTPSIDVTGTGIVVGTVQYMAPEQMQGGIVDARTDLYALGAVLFEMLTGRKAFQEQSQLSQLQPAVIPELDRIVRTCLAKDPDDRWQTARDLLRELTWLRGRTEESVTPVGAVRSESSPTTRAAVVGLLLVAVSALSVVATRYLQPSPVERRLSRFQLQTPATDNLLSLAVSPDGQRLAFVAISEGVEKLCVRSLERVTAQPIPGSERGFNPFWSPDGAALGFFADGKLKSVDIAGGVPRVLADAPNGRGGTWAGDVIVFAPSTADALLSISSAGGMPRPITRFTEGQNSHRWPQFLPDGRRFLFVAAQGEQGTNGLFIASLDGGEPLRVMDEAPFAFAPPKALLFVLNGALVAQPFDPATGALSDKPVAIADEIGVDVTMVQGAFSASQNGVLAYRASIAERRQLTWFDRAGKILGAAAPSDDEAPAGATLSRDGRIALHRMVDGDLDVWLSHAGAIPSRVTYGEGNNFYPVWAPDGKDIYFASNRKGTYDLYRKRADGTGSDELISGSTNAKLPNDISPDGRFLLYATQVPKTGVDLWATSLSGDRASFPVVQTPFEEVDGQFSPDGRWIAYQSNASGRTEIYVQPFPGPASAQPVSNNGGGQPRWAANGEELFYIALDSRLMSVRMTAGSDGRTLSASPPTALFTTRLASGVNVYPAVGIRAQYAVAPDGRFLMNTPTAEVPSPPITVTLNWDAALK